MVPPIKPFSNALLISTQTTVSAAFTTPPSAQFRSPLPFFPSSPLLLFANTGFTKRIGSCAFTDLKPPKLSRMPSPTLTLISTPSSRGLFVIVSSSPLILTAPKSSCFTASPGLGVRNADRILGIRRYGKIRIQDLLRLPRLTQESPPLHYHC